MNEMNRTATDRQKIKRLETNETFQLAIKLCGVIVATGILLGAMLKIA